MRWIISFICSAAVLCLSGLSIYILSRTKKGTKFINPFNILLCGVFVSGTVMFFPIYSLIFSGDTLQILKTFLLSVHNAIRLFIVDGEFSFILDYISPESGWIYEPYTILAAILFVLAPILTFGVVLSFLKNVSAYLQYFRGYFADAYIFSELNPSSLNLAKDLKSANKHRLIVFTDFFENNEEHSYELAEQARAIGAVMFKTDIAALNFSFHSRKRSISFFTLGTNESENIKQALDLIKKYGDRPNTSLYVFSTNVESELLLNKIEKDQIKVRRINEIRSLINRTLYDDGFRIFESAAEPVDGSRKISAVIVGMGQHGTEMTKALAWFCQMDGYNVEINSFDKDAEAESKFKALCPELMDDRFNNGVPTEQDGYHKIRIHSKINVHTKMFTDKLRELGEVTYVFVALGTDEENINVAVMLRSFFLKHGINPIIDAVVWDTDKKNALAGITNYSGQEYNVNFIGDLATSYSEKVVLDSDVEEVALARHLKWGKEEEFWKYEYNYRSSIASAIHRKMKMLCGIPGVEKDPVDREEDELWNLRKLEHRRWDTYMRSEGYVHAEKRNNMAKTHHCLVPFDDLSYEDKIKDDD